MESNISCYQAQPSQVSPDIQLELLPSDLSGKNDTYVIDVNYLSLDNNHVNTNVCTFYYDGLNTKDGFGACCILMDPKKNKILISRHLEFQCTNNVVEYKTLILSLKKAIYLNVECLNIINDSKIIMRDVRNIIHCLLPHLKIFQKEVWCLIYSFKAFNIISMPRMNNVVPYILANAVARFTPLRDGFSIEVIYKPIVPNNVTNFYIFNHDQHILDFLTIMDIFKDLAIDKD